jgi:hypothetical protein
MKTTSLAAFASQLRAWRQQMGWTQVEAADKLGYSASARPAATAAVLGGHAPGPFGP